MPLKALRRLAAAMLAVFLFISLLPAPAMAEEPTAEEIKSQITSIYKKAKSRSRKSSFSGMCGSLVNWQAYLLGIDSSLAHWNGKDEYNKRAAEDFTDTGYYVRCFPDDDYSLEGALNAITLNGTRNAYNLVVGFQWTKTSAGKKYGHTCFIHAILDGVVYYVESDPLRVNGRYYAAGKIITATISEFAADYRSWTDFEGIVEYIKAPYEDRCTEISTDIYVQVEEETPLRTEPCDFAVENIGQTTRTIRPGEIFRITSILLTPEGEYWYKVASGAYFKADGAKLLSGQFDSVSISSVQAPAVLACGEDFQVGGTVTSGGSTVAMLRSQIYSGASGTGVLLQSAIHQVGGTGAALSGSGLDFASLEPGTYHLALSAVVYDEFIENGRLARSWQTVDLWTGDFVVTDDPEGLVVAALDLQGGDGARQVVLERGQGLSDRQEPRREGYRFDGWLTESDAPSQSIGEDTSLHAAWSPEGDTLNGWHWVDGTWRFYRLGQMCAGWLEVCGISYYFGEDGSPKQGWLELDGQKFYLYENGSAAVGTVEVDGVSCTFDACGALQTD